MLSIAAGIIEPAPARAGPGSHDGAVAGRILILMHGDAETPSELALVKPPLERWGYPVDVFDHTEHYDLANSGDRWYLKDQGGGHGDLDLVVGGHMQYAVIIFDQGDGQAYTDTETSSRDVKRMFQEYPFLGIARMENGCTWNGNANNVFQVGTSGHDAKSLTINNPMGTWALEPFVGYHYSGTASRFLNVSERTSDVAVLESYDDGTPAITLAGYSSGARAIFFSFKDWGYAAHVSLLVRFIQEYSGIPYIAPCYTFEIDDCGMPDTSNEDYISLLNWAKSNLGGYSTLAMMEYLMDPDPPADIMVWGLDPRRYANNTEFNPANAALMSDLRSYDDYVVASHGYQHDVDWWKWTDTGEPVDPYADEDGDGTPNWLDSDIEGVGAGNAANPNLAVYTAGAFMEPDLEMQQRWFQRMRQVLDLYGFAGSQVFMSPKNQYLDGYANTLAGQSGFAYMPARSDDEYDVPKTLGWVNGTYVPTRGGLRNVGTDTDVSLTPAEEYLFKLNFMGYAGVGPLSCIAIHVWQIDQGHTPGYELRDSYLSGWQVLQKAGFTLMSTQSAANKSIGWLWTTMSSSLEGREGASLTLDSSAFPDGKARHQLDIVLPFSIKEVKVGDKYWIGVDGDRLSYGKQSGSSETLHILSGTYTSSLPRLSSVSTPATDVLNAVYDPVSRNVSLTLDGTFATKVGVAGFNRPFSEGATSIGADGNSVLAIDLSGVTSTESVSMSVTPSSGSVDVVIQAWSTSGPLCRQWTETGSAPGVSTAHRMGGLSPGAFYAISYQQDGGPRTYLETLQADSCGEISFECRNGCSATALELRAAPHPPANLSPTAGAVDASLTPVLRSTAFRAGGSGDTHDASQWQIRAASGDYSSPVFDSAEETLGLLDIAVPAEILGRSTTYFWRVRYRDNHGHWSCWSEESSFRTLSAPNQPPGRPANVLPADAASTRSPGPRLESSAFSDPDAGDRHSASQWQVRAAAGDYSSPVFDSGASGDCLTTMAMEHLDCCTTYFWRVRYQDSHGSWSDWSPETSFVVAAGGTGRSCCIWGLAAAALVLAGTALVFRWRSGRRRGAPNPH